ncbi:MAG: MFS transporter [Sulfolobales archaeon]|nr:MFS transporter [Sulfolobales archaeon]
MSSERYIYVLAGMISLLAVGWRGSISIFYQYFMDIYGVESVTQVAVYVAIASGIGVVASPLFGALYDRKGPSIPLVISAVAQVASGALALFMKSRPWGEAMWFWYSAAAAAGLVFPSVATSVNPTVMKAIRSSPQVALAFTQSGSYISLTLWSPVITYLILSAGLVEAYLVASLITATALLLCSVTYRKMKPRGTRMRAEKAVGGGSEWRVYIVMLISIFLIAASSITILSYLAPIASEVCLRSGVSREECVQVYAPTAMSIAGVTQSVGGFFWAFLAARAPILTAISALYVVQATSSLAVVVLSGSGSWLALLALLLRLFAFGGEPVLHMVLIPALLGEDKVGKALGLQMSVVMLSSIVGPSVGGILRDISGSYIPTVAGSATLTTSAFLPLLLVTRSLVGRSVRSTER